MQTGFLKAAFVSASVLAVGILVPASRPTLFEGWTLVALVSVAPLALVMWFASQTAARRSEAILKGRR